LPGTLSLRSAITSTTTKNMNNTYTEVTSTLNYLESKRAEMVRMMNAIDVVSEMMPKRRLHDRDPRAEAKQDWAKMQGGMSAYRASVERQISYSQFRKRLIAFGYK
jgi:hypothetical protein